MSENKNGFCKYIGDKRKTKENVGLLLNETDDIVTVHPSVVTAKTSLLEFRFQK